MSTPIQEVPAVVLPAPFPTTADRIAGQYNTKAKVWADKEAEMAQSLYSISLVTYNNAMAAAEQAQAAEQIRLAAVQQTTAIKNQAVAETGAIRDQALAARDAAASSAATAQGLANYQGRWPELAGALAKGATVWHQGHYWGLLDNLADVATAEPGQSAAWAAVGTQVHRLTYDQRGQLRTLGYPGLEWALVEGLGMFAFEVASTEPDDDESCFVTADGAWLLQCPSLDAVAFWLQPWLHGLQERLEDLEAVTPVLRGTGTSSITSIAASSQVSFTAAIPGAAVGRSVAASPLGTLPAQVCVFAKVTAADTVTVYLNNPSTAAATLVAGSWAIAVI